MEYLKLIRFHQWIKNILIFTPVIAIRDLNKDTLVLGILTFLFFSILCSSNYIINDLLDFESDRKDKFKKKRPIAGKKIKKKFAAIVAALLFCTSIFCTYFFLGIAILQVFFIYLLICIFYSLILKHIEILDILCLTIFYLFRVFIGGYVFNINLSIWIYAFSFFIFLALAVLKRSIKLKNNIYNYDDRILLIIISISSSMIAGLVIFLYGLSANFAIYHFNNKNLLFILGIITIFYFLRITKLVYNKKILDDDIIKFVFKDRISYLTFSLIIFLYIFTSRF